VAIIMVIAAGAWFFSAERDHQMEMAYEEHALIGQMKVEQVAAWRTELAEDAAMLAGSPLLAQSLADWLASPDASRESAIPARLEVAVQHSQYSAALLAGADGEVLLQAGAGRTCHIMILRRGWGAPSRNAGSY
jgi:hypothetical protein